MQQFAAGVYTKTRVAVAAHTADGYYEATGRAHCGTSSARGAEVVAAI